MDDHVYNYDHEIVAHSIIYFRSGILDRQIPRNRPVSAVLPTPAWNASTTYKTGKVISVLSGRSLFFSIFCAGLSQLCFLICCDISDHLFLFCSIFPYHSERKIGENGAKQEQMV